MIAQQAYQKSNKIEKNQESHGSIEAGPLWSQMQLGLKSCQIARQS